MIKTQELNVLAHKEACLHELKTLYQQLQLLSYQNQLLHKRKHKANDHTLAQNKKLQMVIKEKLKAVNNFIDKMTNIIEKKNETEQVNLVTSPVNKSTICNTHKMEPENILQKYDMKSPYSKVNIDRKLWLTSPTLSPITLTHDSTVTSSKQVKVESKDAQTNTLSTDIIQNELNVTETAKEIPTYNIIYYDSEMHWCNVCNVFPKTAKDYLHHLHTTRHKTLILEKNKIELPWHKSGINEITEPQIEAGPTKRKPIRGLQFLIPASAWYCKLCLEWIGDLHCASNHLKTVVHAQKYSDFIEENPHWETDWLIERTRAYEHLTETCCQPDKRVILLKGLCDSSSKVINKTALDNSCFSLINSIKVEEEDKKDSSSDTSTSSSNRKSTSSDKSQCRNEISPRRSEKCQRRSAISPRRSKKYHTRSEVSPKRKAIYLTRRELSPRRSERYRSRIEISSRRNEKYQTRSEMSPRRKEIYMTRCELSPRKKVIYLNKNEINSERKIYEGRSEKINEKRSEVRSRLRNKKHPRKRNELCQQKSEINNHIKNDIHQTRNVKDKISNLNKLFSQNEHRKRQSCMKDAVKSVKKIKKQKMFDIQSKSDGECTSSSSEEVIEVEHPLSLSNFDLDEMSTNKQIAQKEITSSVVSNFKAILSWKLYAEKLITNNSLQMSQIKSSLEEKTMSNSLQVKPLSSLALMKIDSITSDPHSLQIMEKLMNSWKATKSKIIKRNSNNFDFKSPI